MRFPLLDITTRPWHTDLDTDLIIFDRYIYTNKESVFNAMYRDVTFIDCEGRHYRAVKQGEQPALWRRLLRLLPNIWRREIIFQPTGECWSVEELKRYVMARVSELEENETNRKGLEQLEKAGSCEEVICMSIE